MISTTVYACKELAHVCCNIDDDMFEEYTRFNQSMQQQKSKQHASCWTLMKSALDQIRTIPREMEKMIFFNMMVRANQLIDDPHTTFYNVLPGMLLRLAAIMEVPILNVGNIKTLLFAVPDHEIRQAYPKYYFVEHPSLMLIWHDSETGEMHKYIVSVGCKKQKNPSGPVQMELLDTTTQENFFSVTPIRTLNRKRQLTKRMMSSETYERRYQSKCTKYVDIRDEVKEETGKMKELSFCEMAAMIATNDKVDLQFTDINKVNTSTETGRIVEIEHDETCLSSSAPSIIKQEEEGDTIMAPVTQ